MNENSVKTDGREAAAKRRLLSRLLSHEMIDAASSSSRDDSEIESQLLDFAHNIENRKRRVREHYPVLQRHAYFNYGAQGPLHKNVIDAIQKTFVELQYFGASSSEAQARSLLESQLLRRSLAKLLGIKSENLVLTENTTIGCNIVLWGINWQPGDHLLVSDGENPSLLIAIETLKRRFSLEVEILPVTQASDTELLERLAAGIRPTTRLLVLSHVLWNTGRRLPLDSILQLRADHRFGSHLRVLIDGAQAVGMMPLNLSSSAVDFYAFGGQKWLCGPDGTGGLYVNQTVLDELQPTFAGWRAIDASINEYELTMFRNARRFEVASSSPALQAGLRTALSCHADFADADWRFNHLLKMSEYLWNGLMATSQAGFPVQCLTPDLPESGLICFQIKQPDSLKLVPFLAAQKILTKFIPNPGCLRACVNYLTTEDEVEELLLGIKLFVKRVGYPS